MWTSLSFTHRLLHIGLESLRDVLLHVLHDGLHLDERLALRLLRRVDDALGDLVGAPCEWDVILAGDIFYDDTSGAIGGWLSDCAAQGCQVFIGDPGRARLPRQRVEQLAQYEARRSEGLQDQDIRRTRVWSYR